MSTGASREAPVDNLGTWAKAEKHALSTGASREALVDNACFSGILPFSGLGALV